MPRAAALAITAGTGSFLSTLIAAYLWTTGDRAAADAMTYVSSALAIFGFVAMAAIPIRSK